jgi:general secretion pathway protein G
VEAYYFVEATWPKIDLSDIKSDADYFPDGIPTCPVDQTSYELAPTPIHRVTTHREGDGTHTW